MSNKPIEHDEPDIARDALQDPRFTLNADGEMVIRAIAVSVGYLAAVGRIRPGEEIDWPMKNCKRCPRPGEFKDSDTIVSNGEDPDGPLFDQYVLPSWLLIAHQGSRAYVAAAPQRAADKELQAGIESSGGRGRPRKDSFVNLMHKNAAAGALAASGTASGKQKRRELAAALGKVDIVPEDKS